ncbi:MAG TPA: kelch repeat-containing protein [Polyangiaceae bacterium]|nr:kelch repeat-containing protein [Polyangiaceae bacterium]
MSRQTSWVITPLVFSAVLSCARERPEGAGASGIRAGSEPAALLGSTRQALAGTSAMVVARYGHAAVALPDGRVLVCGGRTASLSDGAARAATDHCEYYDPARSTWSDAGAPTLPSPRAGLSLTLLNTGKVLVVGGFGTDSSVYGEAYTLGTSGFVGLEPLLPRFAHSATLLKDGGVLLVGGSNADGEVVVQAQLRLPDAESLPLDARWENTGNRTLGAHLHGAATLTNGDVMITGGMTESGSISDAVFVYSAASKQLSSRRSLPAPRYAHTATMLPNGDVLVVGGVDQNGAFASKAYRFLQSTQAWQEAGTPMERTSHLAARLDRFVIVAGGVGKKRDAENDVQYSVRLRTVEAYDPNTNTWTTLAPLQAGRDAATLTPVQTPSKMPALLIAGGSFGSAIVPTSELIVPGLGGNGCQANSDCVTGHCSPDGVCCDSACDGACEACNEPGSEGICKDVSGPPRGESRSCAGGFACAQGKCADRCEDKADCQTGYYCNSNHECVSPGVLGSACNSADACTDGLSCSGGVCCEEACDGPCQQCNAKGQCILLEGAPNRNRDCADMPHDAGCNPTCDGKHAECTFVAGAECGDASCNPTVHAARSIGTCNEQGRCVAEEQPCGAYGCIDNVCRDECTKPEHCNSNLCQDGRCVDELGKGDDCNDTKDCMPGLTCVDGACCTEQACPEGASCRTPGKAGDCMKLENSPCEANLECASEQCFDGVCVAACESKSNCGEGQECSNGACIPSSGAGGESGNPNAAPRCSADFKSSIVDGSTSSCEGYRCNPATGKCAATCKQSSECSTGYLCDPEHHCRVPPERRPIEGCSVQPLQREAGSPASHVTAWLLGLGAVAFARRRRAARGSD